MGLEPLYKLDLVIDQKKPLWSWLQEMAALYRSAIIYSNGKYKIISDRDDLPVRQVFHSGNIIRERTEVRVGADPMRINQITGQFSNKEIKYERDILIIQDSQSVFIDNDAIKPLDLDLTGIVRKGEVNRRLSVEMRTRNQVKTEMTFFTNVQGIVVEPGDVCVAGIVMSNFDMGYGGIALDGSTTSLLADKPVALNSGTNYDLWVWHVAADTPELRTLIGTTEVLNLTPTSPFDYAVEARDRWAVAPQSEDLVKLLVKKVVHQEDGLTQIVGDEFISVGYLLDCPGSETFDSDAIYDMPTNPWSITTAQTNCQVCFQLHFTAPGCVGGTVLRDIPDTPYLNNAFALVYPTTTNLPQGFTDFRINLFNQDSAGDPGTFNQYGLTAENTITFISGANSGISRRIVSYPSWVRSNGPANAFLGESWAMYVAALPNRSKQGDQYYITFAQTSNVAGMRLRYWTGSYSAIPFGSAQITQVFYGTSGCFDLSDAGNSLWVVLDLVSSAGAFSDANILSLGHAHTFQFNLPGCFAQDERLPFSVRSITAQSISNLLEVYLPASELTADQFFQVKAYGFLNELCASGEATRVAFGVTYGGSTVIDSHVVVLRDANSAGTSIGSNTPFTLTARIQAYTVPVQHARVFYRYDGPILSGSAGQLTNASTEFTSGMLNSLSFWLVQSFTFTTKLHHVDTTGAVHSHACAAVALDHGEFEILDNLEN